MDLDILSGDIVLACLQAHGRDEFFFRTDGLQFEERRAKLRREYLEAHPDISEQHRQAILSASATPGMTREELTAAWGLLEEDTRMSFGHVTESSLGTYAYFNGFRVGDPYTIYLHDNLVIGIKPTQELAPPHELELTMRVAEEKRNMRFFYPGRGDFLLGSDIDQHRAGYDVLHNFLYTIEPVLPYSISQIEQHIDAKGLSPEYKLVFSRLGIDPWRATAELRSYVALSLLPFPPAADFNMWDDTVDELSVTRTANEIPPALLAPEDPASLPPEEWFAHIADGLPPEGAFPTALKGHGRDATFDEGVELLRIERIKGRIFRVHQIPLLAIGVAPYDRVELEWRPNDVTPRFKRLVESGGQRVVRAVIKPEAIEQDLGRFVKDYVEYPQTYHYENGLFAFTILTPRLKDHVQDRLGYMSKSWAYADTLTQR